VQYVLYPGQVLICSQLYHSYTSCVQYVLYPGQVLICSQLYHSYTSCVQYVLYPGQVLICSQGILHFSVINLRLSHSSIIQ